jgi:hypothetical protein
LILARGVLNRRCLCKNRLSEVVSKALKQLQRAATSWNRTPSCATLIMRPPMVKLDLQGVT